jgi:predicted Zn-dependent protease
MRHPVFVVTCLAGAMALSGCMAPKNGEVNRAFRDVNVVDESNLNDIMLTVGDPNEAVTYFQRSLADNPDRIDLMRGLAQSLVKAKRATEGASAWARVVDHKDSTANDRVD